MSAGKLPPVVPLELPKDYKEIQVRKYDDPHRGIEAIITDQWSLIEINAISSAIHKARRVFYNQLRQEGESNND